MEFKVTYDHGFSTHTEIINADSLEEAQELARLKSVYKFFSIEESAAPLEKPETKEGG